jgi:hypothetical protein
MNNGDRKHPEAGDLWMSISTTEKYRILAVSNYGNCPMVVFHSADQTPSTPHLFAKAVGISPLFWQVESDTLYPFQSDSPLGETLWGTQGGHCWIMAEEDFMGYNEGPNDAHNLKFFLIAETSLHQGDRVSISLPSVQSEIICSVLSVEDGKVIAEFKDGDAEFQVSVVRDRVRKLR